jgi:CDP-4-dehydro-6-deoxyglucose reductase
MKPINYGARPKLADSIYQVLDYKLLTPNVAQVFLAPKSSPIQYQAGQYIKIVQPDQSTSPFSIANAPQADGVLEFHLLFLKENRKAWDIFQQIKEKKDLTLRGPYGQCSADHLSQNKPLIFIARSTGFSPVKAVVEELIRRPSYPSIHLYWSVPGWRDLYLRELINVWVKELRHFHFTAVLTREVMPVDAGVKYGSAPELVFQDYPDFSSHQIYVSGPEKMVYSALETFQKKGLPRESFYSDVFDYQHE